MQRLSASLLALALLITKAHAAPDPAIHLIPQPVSVKQQTGSFSLDKSVVLSVEAPAFDHAAGWFTGQLESQTGIRMQRGKSGKVLQIATMADRNVLGKEGYTLTVTPSRIVLRANDAAGVFYGLQTLLQLQTGGKLPCVEIMDYPRFAWRGLMLDVSRHFFTKAEVLRYIDEMVRYKYNTLHLHLSDDQGWRIEIKSLPQLTQHGAWRVSRTGRWGEFLPSLAGEPTPYGGFYTQDDMREIIRYAQDRNVTILPEIDVPAHSLALISSYNNLSCTQLPYSVNPGSRGPVREDNALCIGNDTVFTVLDKIFSELATIFPCEYIHIGGDEAYKGFWATCPKCQRRMADEHLKNVDELQSYFVRRMEKMLNSKGKRLIGWDEILEGGLAPEATVMSWRGMSGGVTAARMGHKVVMTPWDYTYLDLYQGENTVEPPTYGICRLRDSYNYDPVPDSVDEKLILGGQGNLWTESVPTFRQVEYMTWPRALALSEVYWSPKASRNWDDFTRRMEEEFHYFDAVGIKYARSSFNVIFTPKRTPDRDFTVDMTTEVKGLDIYYTFDNTNPDTFSTRYDGTPVRFPLGAAQLNVITYRDGRLIGQQVNIRKDELSRRIDQGRHIY